MATVIGDFASDPSRFHHSMAFPPQQQRAHHHQPPHQNQRLRSTSSARQPASSASPSIPTSTSSRQQRPAAAHPIDQPRTDWTRTSQQPPASSDPRLKDAASRFPTPPDSSSPSASNSADPSSPSSCMDTAAIDKAATGATVVSNDSNPPSTAASDVTVVPPFSTSSSSASRPPVQSIPSPASDSFPSWTTAADSPSLHTPHNETPAPTQQRTIKIRDLAHVHSLARADLVTGNGPGILNDPPLSQMKYDISEMPIGDIIEMVAALLTKITTTNDLQHDALNRNAAHQRQAQQQHQQQQNESAEGGSSAGGNSGGGSTSSPFANSVLAFHGKNVPAITILSYLSRIHKYCPTTFEVFLSLLVYFDRMTERVNDLVMKSEQERQLQQERAEQRRQQQAAQSIPSRAADREEDVVMSDGDVVGGGGGHESDETDEDLADSSDDEDDSGSVVQRPRRDSARSAAAAPVAPTSATVSATAAPAPAVASTATFFVVDSFNIHRLIIAGVTCASKFFSDVFYTNSRYAKVGGLPLAELNHLELQFLLLNDFRLAVPVEDLEAYATMLVEFYAREVVAQRSRPAAGASD